MKMRFGTEDPTVRDLMSRLLRAYRTLSTHQGDHPPATALPVQYHIDTGDTAPVMMKRCRHAQTEEKVIEDMVPT
ncbi:unnamed protein product [Phytophthora fragariaefolia]|uniref:Unnamed protein product n=1 Tax=Phytophthora fragariaefolia TaxID=1490495 RepID=A0A9W6YD08_9STRA|nr:unnamed protein product [Phytophthora fragariaefolia]